MVAHFHYVLSIGAIFSIFAGIYYWGPKILGVNIDDRLGAQHFWVMLVGVNMTFLPQHFSGLQGIPRRVPDYPDAFAGWNVVSSAGSIISTGATIIFLLVVYRALINRTPAIDNAWGNPEYFSDASTYVQGSLYYPTIEWVLPSPTPMHAYSIMPVQS